MTAIRMRPKSDYLHTAEWGDLYLLTEHWLSDLNFYQDESQFLEGLISKYVVLMMQGKRISDIQAIVGKLKKLEKRMTELLERTSTHLKDIGMLKEYAFNKDETNFRGRHEKLEDDIVSFINEFREMKKEVFDITKHVLKTEKMKHLLSN